MNSNTTLSQVFQYLDLWNVLCVAVGVYYWVLMHFVLLNISKIIMLWKREKNIEFVAEF